MKITKDNFLKEIEKKNPDAIEYIVDTYGGLLKAVLRRNLGEHCDRWEECFDDCLLAVWNNPKGFESKKADFKNWLCAIAKYKAIDLCRREQKHSYQASLDEGGWENIPDPRELGTEDSAAGEELSKLLACLSREDRALFVRRYVEEQSIEQITEELGMNRDLIYTRISRGKKKIRKFFGERGGEY